jgi:hypothetical protein
MPSPSDFRLISLGLTVKAGAVSDVSAHEAKQGDLVSDNLCHVLTTKERDDKDS